MALLGIGFLQPLQANPLKAPHRLVNNQTVDLSPLFRWWTNHAGARPLGAWVHITGSIVGTNSWGWVLEGRAEASSRQNSTPQTAGLATNRSSKILLLHPPLQDLAEFEKLKAELQPLNEQRKQLLNQEAEAKRRAEAIAKQNSGAKRNSAEARELNLENKQLISASHLADSEIKLLDRRIQPLKVRLATYPNSNRYVVDCFALETGKDAQAEPIYDHGSVFQ